MTMKLDDAIAQIEKSFAKMNRLYGRTVFDEVAVVGLSGGSLALAYYQGPREANFMQSFADDSQALRKELMAQQTGNGGEFSFTRDGDGAATDAYICLGPDVYLFCNQTTKSMKEITDDPCWLDAQGQFLNLSQYFAVDPLVL